MQVKKQQLVPDMEQGTCSKLGKEYFQAIYCHPAYLTSMQSTSCEMLNWMKHHMESSLIGENVDDTNPYGRKQRGSKEPHDEIEGV